MVVVPLLIDRLIGLIGWHTVNRLAYSITGLWSLDNNTFEEKNKTEQKQAENTNNLKKLHNADMIFCTL